MSRTPCPRCAASGTVALETRSDHELEAVADNLQSPLHQAAEELLHARRADDWSRRTPAGGEA